MTFSSLDQSSCADDEVRRLSFETDEELVRTALARWKLLPHSAKINTVDGAIDFYLQELNSRPNSCNATTFFANGAGSDLWLSGLKKLDWDTEFFGFGIGRLEPFISPAVSSIMKSSLKAGDDLIKLTIAGAVELDIDLLSAQVHCSDSLAQLSLQRAGFCLMDTIVTYEMACTGLARQVDACIRLAEPSDLQALARISGECFSNRNYNVNRFNGDPQFAPDKVREMYSLWLENSLNGKLADKVFAYIDEGKPIGFITVTLPTKSELAVGIKVGRIPLNAVEPEHHRQGIYTKLVQYAIQWLANQGAEFVELKTQLPNAGVHRTWARLGANIACSFHTFHLSLKPLYV